MVQSRVLFWGLVGFSDATRFSKGEKTRLNNMFDPNNLFHAILVIPILNGLLAVYKLFSLIHVPGALGLSLIVLTVAIRLLLHPLTMKQLKSTKKLTELKPELDKLSKLYKDDKTRLQQEQLRLYKEAGVNPAAGCLPLLIQMPILIALYNLFFQILNAKDMVPVLAGINHVVYAPWLRVETLDLSFFGLNLAVKPSQWQTQGVFLLAIPIITAVLQYWQTKMMVPGKQTTDNTSTSLSTNKQQITKTDKDAPKEEKKEEDMGTAMQKQMSIMMPAMIGFFAYSFPLGLALYWNTFTIFGIIQQLTLKGDTHGKKNS
jgi:YidC/Oxa1 family membrane protein insertase